MKPSVEDLEDQIRIYYQQKFGDLQPDPELWPKLATRLTWQDAPPVRRKRWLRLVTPSRYVASTVPRPPERSRVGAGLRAWVTIVAAMLVVGLLATTFALFSHRSLSSVPITATPTRVPATPNLAPTLGPLPSKGWSQVTSLSVTSNFLDALPAIAPSNPRIVYEETASPEPTLRRTSDGGATWQSFPLPVKNATISMQLYVSPLNPNVVVLHTDGWLSQNHTCALVTDTSAGTATTSAASGDKQCDQLLSTNGGRSWTQTSDYFDAAPHTGYDQPGNYGGVGVPGIFFVQGNRLYTYGDYRCQPPPLIFECAGILLVSLDGGVTWSPAPAPSPANLCGVAMAPTGTVMFAITSSQCLGGVGGIGTFNNTIWRSDDAGAHWAPMSQLPFSAVNSLLVIPLSGAAYPSVYLTTTTETSNSLPPVTRVRVSRDGGKTWTDMSQSGIPTGWFASEMIAQASDGSAIALVGPAESPGLCDTCSPGFAQALYAWRPDGSTWQMVAPIAPTGLWYLLTPSQTPGGGETLWAVGTRSYSASGETDLVYRLQL